MAEERLKIMVGELHISRMVQPGMLLSQIKTLPTAVLLEDTELQVITKVAAVAAVAVIMAAAADMLFLELTAVAVEVLVL